MPKNLYSFYVIKCFVLIDLLYLSVYFNKLGILYVLFCKNVIRHCFIILQKLTFLLTTVNKVCSYNFLFVFHFS